MGRYINANQLVLELGSATSPVALPPSTARATLFFAILPDQDCAARADRLAGDLHREHSLAGKPRSSSLLHMTLCLVAENSGLTEDKIALAQRAGGRVGGAPFTLQLDEVFSFRQVKHPIVLCATEGNDVFRMLHVRLALALQNCGLKAPAKRNLKPHMTLAYKGKEIARTRLSAPIPIVAREFVLIRSHFGESRHDYLGRWPLREA